MTRLWRYKKKMNKWVIVWATYGLMLVALALNTWSLQEQEVPATILSFMYTFCAIVFYTVVVYRSRQ